MPEEKMTITEDHVEQLVDRFYMRVHADVRLGEIFSNELSGNWDEHLAKMKQFWRSVLLKTREYNGRPVPAHTKLKGIKSGDFVTWLSLFHETASEVLPKHAAMVAIQNAERIASSLWFAMNDDIFQKTPDWSKLISELKAKSVCKGAAK